jgi:hypothetical protein
VTLRITADWERLETGPAEERATAAFLKIIAGGAALTEVEDLVAHSTRTGIRVSAYPLASWFAWNWWRLRWEPRTPAPDWGMAHCLRSVGDGYIWPDLTIVSDGERVMFLARPTRGGPAEPVRYLSNRAAVVPAPAVESELAAFVEQVRRRLRDQGIATSDLDILWAELEAERTDPAMGQRRRFEALLGYGPDDADPDLLERLVADAGDSSDAAMSEIAALSAGTGRVPSLAKLREIASAHGFAGRSCDAARLPAETVLPAVGSVPAWQRGVAAGRALRRQAGFGAGAPIPSARLAEPAGVQPECLAEGPPCSSGPALAFAIDDEHCGGRIVLRLQSEAGRRVEVARLLGDRIAAGIEGGLFPATRLFTYRQKVQRAFAAELLCPIDAVIGLLHGDFSEESQDEVASHYNVSPRTVEMLLLNSGLIDREDLLIDIEAGQPFDLAA